MERVDSQPTASAPDPTVSVTQGLPGRVRRIRDERGLTAQAVADASGLSLRLIRQLESGHSNIALGRLVRVAEALDVHVVQLLLPLPTSREARLGISDFERASAATQRRAFGALTRTVARAGDQSVALLGLRGAGKTTVGQALAIRLDRPFVELDSWVEDSAGMTLRELFEIHGESYYRRLERRCLERIYESRQPCVVAVSGGIVRDDATYETLLQRTVTVWLKANPEDHMQRVMEQGDLRPMRDRDDAMAELRAILARRTPRYARAELAVETSNLTVDEVLSAVVAELQPATAGSVPAVESVT